MINAVEILGNKVYVGTPAGISWFDKTAIPSFSQCVFKMLGISVNGVSKQENDRIDVKYGNNNIRFDFVAISFKSAGKINYAYRLIGLDSTWQNTSQTTIEFIALPPGEYKLELVAINKFDVKSIPYYTTIHVQSPLWQTRWFILACIGMSILLTWFVVNALNRQNKKKEVVKRNIEQKIQELEQKALRAQMNPHFIFNSLHSVQGFVLDKDFESANRYLGRFANLIRQTLENSFQSSITIADEIKYLSSYLELEKMRSQNQFNYTITIGPHILADRVNIPCMILQPYVENAILHGIKNKPDHQGKIDITFKKEQNGILCTIRDNGIGRVKASALKQFSSVYQSRGMQLTRERINLINKDLNEGIDVQIHDYTDEDSVAGGTEVVIHFPDAYLKKHSAHYD
jgi:two-component sensor histidine kinase